MSQVRRLALEMTTILILVITENVNPTYPTCSMPVSIHAQIGVILRTLMDINGFSGTKLIGYEHNWNDAAVYPVQLVHYFIIFSDESGWKKYYVVPQMDQAESAFDGVNLIRFASTK